MTDLKIEKSVLMTVDKVGFGTKQRRNKKAIEFLLLFLE